VISVTKPESAMKLRLLLPALVLVVVPWLSMAPVTSDSAPLTTVVPSAVSSEEECRHCVEDFYPPESETPAHWWVGSSGCDGENLSFGDGGCRECTSTHCEDPEVPHHGSCPETLCDGSGGNSALAAEMLENGNAVWLAEQLAAHPKGYGFDAKLSAFQVYGCDGSVRLHVFVSDKIASELQQADGQ
jgi:hypothetical protein